ncbi:MAG TPA: nuclear transport factor 2 family protein, partial [Thermomicrobiales bacterium]|nr:nuclear transport factor 2 family protein [Thermomicrobiales bacterium]
MPTRTTGEIALRDPARDATSLPRPVAPPCPRPGDAAGGRRTVGPRAQRVLAAAAGGATGLALLALAVALVAPASIDAPNQATPSIRTTVLAYYAAVDRLLQSGDVAALDAVTTPDVIIADAFGQAQGRPALARRLQLRLATAPDTQLTVAEIFVAGDRAVARLAVTGERIDQTSDSAGAARTMAWPAFETLRVSDGRIAALQTIGDAGIAREPLLQASFAARSVSSAGISFARAAFAPGASTVPVLAPEAIVVVIQRGALRIQMDDAPLASSAAVGERSTSAAAIDRTLRAGDAIVVPSADWFNFRNETTEPSVALAASSSPALTRPGALLRSGYVLGEGGRAAASGWPLGVEVEPLPAADGMPSGPLAATAARLTLAPGIALMPRRLSGAALLSVESGRLGLVVNASLPGPSTSAPAARTSPDHAMTECGAAATLASGESIALSPGAVRGSIVGKWRSPQ